MASPTEETSRRTWQRRRNQTLEKRTSLRQLRLRNRASHTPHPLPTTNIGTHAPRLTYGVHLTFQLGSKFAWGFHAPECEFENEIGLAYRCGSEFGSCV